MIKYNWYKINGITPLIIKLFEDGDSVDFGMSVQTSHADVIEIVTDVEFWYPDLKSFGYSCVIQNLNNKDKMIVFPITLMEIL